MVCRRAVQSSLFHDSFSFFQLANALSQLDELIKDQKYAETSQTLAVSDFNAYNVCSINNDTNQAVKELSAPFKSYLSVPQVALIWARIQTLQGELRTKLDHEFDALYVRKFIFFDLTIPNHH